MSGMPEVNHNHKRENLDDMKVAILGGGVSGTSLALLASRLGADVLLSDSAAISDSLAGRLHGAGIAYEERGHTEKVSAADLVVVGSGFPPKAPVLAEVEQRGVPVLGELDFVLPRLDGRVIGITGSNGKTTTTSLAGYLFSSLGLRTAVAGNIGTPVADYAGKGETYDCIVVELSSFQLHWAKRISLDGAVVTNLAPDHIDWHGSYDNYVRAKARILDFVKGTGFAIVQERDLSVLQPSGDNIYSLSWDSERGERKIVLDSRTRTAFLGDRLLLAFEDSGLLGSHNMENAAMALAALFLSGQDGETARSHLVGYVAPPHRCALVLEKGGVRYVDDSKGTNIAATVTALSAIEGEKLIILGGKGKGEDYSTLVEPLKAFASYAILIGEESTAIAKALEAGGFASYSAVADMEAAVRLAAARAKAGDVVLLSPACTSWDMYKNYGERGDHFASLVERLVGGKF